LVAVTVVGPAEEVVSRTISTNSHSKYLWDIDNPSKPTMLSAHAQWSVVDTIGILG
jgi:hypothetical protein